MSSYPNQSSKKQSIVELESAFLDEGRKLKDAIQMKLMQWLSFLIILALLLIHGIRSEIFILDNMSMLLVLLLAIPLLAPFIQKAKWFGAEFEFRKNIKEAELFVQKSEVVAKEKYGDLAFRKQRFETFSTATARPPCLRRPKFSSCFSPYRYGACVIVRR